MKARNVSVSIYDAGNGELRVWCSAFTIKGTLKRGANGLIDEAHRKMVETKVRRFLENLELPEVAS